MANREPFAIEEWYHCFNRGVDKRIVFENEDDANRFLMLLHNANSREPIDLYNFDKPKLGSILKRDRGERIVSIGGYCLMPNHFHLLLKEIEEGGITSFMRKLITAYTMYFNARNERTGNLFLRPFRSRHVADDRYFQKVLQYIHCNPAELFEPAWKKGKVKNIRILRNKLLSYPYSSLKSYEDNSLNAILSPDGFKIATQVPLSQMLSESRSYYLEIGVKENDTNT